MTENKYSWNQTLKFSWGHIIAFVALVFVSYVAYMGDFYKNGGNFMEAAIKVLVMDILILGAFIGAQILKGTDAKFDRAIIAERTLIVLCPIVFVLAMMPYNHFWTVLAQSDEIESSFSASIQKSKQVFEDYDQYSSARIATYSKALQHAIANKGIDRNAYAKAGFTGTNDATMKQVFVGTLQLQLQSQNTNNLKSAALKWIDNANQGTTVWNAFLIGNIDKISDAVEGWNNALVEVSQPVLSNEPKDTKPFDADMAVRAELEQLRSLYTQSAGVSLNTIWTGILLFAMLIFPYVLQSRNTKAQGYYFLLPFAHRQPKPKTVDKGKTSGDAPTQQTDKQTDIYSGTF